MSTGASYNSTRAYILNTKCTIAALDDAKKAIAIHRISKDILAHTLDYPLNVPSAISHLAKKGYYEDMK